MSARSIHILLLTLCLLAGISQASAQTSRPQLFASTFTSRYEVPIAIGITGEPWKEGVQWSAGIRYRMAWPYELGWGDGRFFYPDNPIYRVGLMVQRSSPWPERWEGVGWEVTVLQSYIKGVNGVPYEFFRLEYFPGLYYRLPLSVVDLKFYGAVGLRTSIGYTQDAFQPSVKNYELLLRANYLAGLSVIWNRKPE